MEKAEEKYTSLRNLGSWGEKSAKDEQIISLTTQIKSLKDGSASKEKKGSGKSNAKSDYKDEKSWKKDRSLSSSNKLERNDKTYNWCTGPGHGGIGMWAFHGPGSCTGYGKGDKKGFKKKGGGNKNASAIGYNPTALTGIIKNSNNDLSDDEVQSKLEAIMAVIQS